MNRLFVFLVALAISINCSAQIIIKADDSHIHYVGRVLVSDSAATLAWSASAVELNFYGSSISAAMQDQYGYSAYNVVIDGQVKNVIHPDKTRNNWLLASGLPKGKHHLQLFKRTEWAMGKTWFYGFFLTEGGKFLQPSPTPKHKIEFYGDSITCGYADEDFTGQDRGTPPYEDGYLSYAAIVARHYNAELFNTSKSGIGITVSWFPQIMPEIYDRVDNDDPTIKWDFAKYQPDIIVINLFQNDSWLVVKSDNDQFKARFGTTAPTPEFIINAYSNFVKTIRSKYPKAQIICALGSMDATQAGSVWPGYIEKAVAGLHDSRIYTHFFPYKNTNGHPSIKEQQAMADDLIAYIDGHVKW